MQNLGFMLSFHLMQRRPRKLPHCSVTQFIYLYNKKNKGLVSKGMVDFVLVQNLEMPNVNNLVQGYFFFKVSTPQGKDAREIDFSVCFPPPLQSFFSKKHNKDT